MGKRKEQKYARLHDSIEEQRDALTGELTAIVAGRFGAESRLAGVEFRMLHRRVFICKLTVQRPGEPAVEWSVVAKQSREAAGEYGRMLAIWRAGFNGAEPFHVRMCEPLGLSTKGNTFFMELVDGHTGRNLMRESGSLEPAKHAAHALSQLHALSLTIEGRSLVTSSWGAVVTPPMREAMPDLAPRLDALVADARASDAVLGAARVAVHGDFHLAQVTIGEGGAPVWLLDFGAMFMGDPAFDVGEYLAHVQEEDDFHDVAGARSLFLDEYFRYADPAIRERVPLYEGMAWLRRAMHKMADEDDGPATARKLAERALAAAG